jgi:hypothetical protein
MQGPRGKIPSSITWVSRLAAQPSRYGAGWVNLCRDFITEFSSTSVMRMLNASWSRRKISISLRR